MTEQLDLEDWLREHPKPMTTDEYYAQGLNEYKQGWDECSKTITPNLRKHYKEFYTKKYNKRMIKLAEENQQLKELLDYCRQLLEMDGYENIVEEINNAIGEK